MNDWLYLGARVNHKSDAKRRNGEVVEVHPFGEVIVQWPEIKGYHSHEQHLMDDLVPVVTGDLR